MDASEWDTVSGPGELLRFLPNPTPRKLLLNSAAFVSRLAGPLPPQFVSHVVRAAEGFADGNIGLGMFELLRRRIPVVGDPGTEDAEQLVAFHGWRAVRVLCAQSGWGTPAQAARTIAHEVREAIGYANGGVPWVYRSAAKAIVQSEQSTLVRDVFGNCVSPVSFDPLWRSPTAVALAKAIYRRRAFDELPVLADALEEARCDDPRVLGHCRGPGPHVRGCWAVDLVLGRDSD